MMDTGIDIPECVNLVFFKKIRSKTKFWQMIGRGTRLAPNLGCVDCINGEYIGKKYFMIFDYCGNFEYFRQKPNGFEGSDTKSLSENIFGKKIRLAVAMQESAFVDDSYQDWRKQLVEECNEQVRALNTELVSVKLKREFVERYSKPKNFTYISEGAKGELITHIAPLVYLNEQDEYAKRFDNFMYGMMIAHLEAMPAFKHAKKQLCDIAAAFERKITIPQIKAKLPIIKEINSDSYWAANDILLFENTRRELRDLMKFLVDDGPVTIITKLTDPILDTKEGEKLDPAYDFEDYKKKVNRYVNEHGNSIAIHKLTHNIPLTAGDYGELERVLTEELGSKEDYEREFGDTPFGLLIRKIAKLDHDAAMEAFSSFINDASLNQKQIAFVHKIINHIEQNGYMEDMKELMKPPFDKPISFVKLFDARTRTALMEKINEIKENAVNVVA